MGDEPLRLYTGYEVIARDKNGEVIQTREIEDAGTFTMEDIHKNAIFHGLDEIEIRPTGAETRRGDDVIHRIETTA